MGTGMSLIDRVCTHLLLVVKALVVVLKDGCAFCFARIVLGICVGGVAC